MTAVSHWPLTAPTLVKNCTWKSPLLDWRSLVYGGDSHDFRLNVEVCLLLTLMLCLIGLLWCESVYHKLVRDLDPLNIDDSINYDTIMWFHIKYQLNCCIITDILWDLVWILFMEMHRLQLAWPILIFFFVSVTCRYRFLPIPIFFLKSIIDRINLINLQRFSLMISHSAFPYTLAKIINATL